MLAGTIAGGLGALQLAGGSWSGDPLPIKRLLALVFGLSLGGGVGTALFLFIVTKLRWLTLDQAVGLVRKR